MQLPAVRGSSNLRKKKKDRSATEDGVGGRTEGQGEGRRGQIQWMGFRALTAFRCKEQPQSRTHLFFLKITVAPRTKRINSRYLVSVAIAQLISFLVILIIVVSDS